ncbi:hypothetical protein YC2023_117147 [Brassica napus]
MIQSRKVHEWQKEGARIVYRHRVNREGYKAGNLKSAMNCSFVKDYESMSIFDADFQPLPDFLKKKAFFILRTTAEDMDIAVRAYLHGWKFIFLNDVEISIGKKFNLIFFFFLLKKLILPFNSFTLFCIILPMTMFVPKTELPAWVVCYIPSTMSFLNILPAPKSFPFIVPYLLFDNTMSVTKFNAMVSGLFQLGSAYE